MRPEKLQRVLLLGLGGEGMAISDHFLSRIKEVIGPVKVMDSVKIIIAEESNDDDVLALAPDTPFSVWQPNFERRVETALRQISHLDHIADLARYGLRLERPNEIHLILIADLRSPLIQGGLEAISNSLRNTVARALGCYASLTGLLLHWPNEEAPSLERGARGGEKSGLQSEASSNQSFIPSLTFPLEGEGMLFDRGCFLFSAANEMGLVLGNREAMRQRAAHFLTLLTVSPLGVKIGESDSAAHLSFGLSLLRWPGQTLLKPLCIRAAAEALDWLVGEASRPERFFNETTPYDQLAHQPPGDLLDIGARAARKFLSGQKLAPPLVMESLIPLIPLPPDHLTARTPDSPWPWLMAETKIWLEQKAQQWQEKWPAAQLDLEAHLQAIGDAFQLHSKQVWSPTARQWLTTQSGQLSTGWTVKLAASLETASKLLAEYEEGIAARLEEAETELAQIEAQAIHEAEALNNRLKALPNTPLTMLLVWGTRPFHWPAYWRQVRQAQAAVRRYALILRARLTAEQSAHLYQIIQPLYQRLTADWSALTALWTARLAQIERARETTAKIDWRAELEETLRDSKGPWTVEMVEALYQEATGLLPEACWERIGSLEQWAAEGLTAEDILEQLHLCARNALTSISALPADLALTRQLPDEAPLAIFLRSFLEQAAPFWPYDETELPEERRAQSYLERWLLLPGGENSPLTQYCRDIARPPDILQGLLSEEVIAISIRQGVNFSFPSDKQGGKNV